MFTERTSVGLDVHARSVVATAIDTTTGELFKERLVPSNEIILEWLARLPGPVAVTYEAGPTGFGLARAMTAAQVRCVVAAPSKLARPAGDRVKTDARDACSWRSCCATTTSPASGSRPSPRKPHGTWSEPVRMSAAI